MSLVKNLRGIIATLLLLFIIVNSPVFAAGEPSCSCDLLDPFSQAYDDCVTACKGDNIPVNGNIWLLAVVGVSLFVIKKKVFTKE